MSKPNHANYPKVRQWLTQKGFVWHEFNNGTQFRILGNGVIVDLWPGRMVYHVIESEDVVSSHDSGYPKLDFYFNPKQLNKLLNGE